MKSFKLFYEDLELQKAPSFASPGKDINFAGPKPLGFKGDTLNGDQIRIEFDLKSRKSPKGKRATRLKNIPKR